MEKKSNIIIYVPFEISALSDEDKQWIANFENIFRLSLKQLISEDFNLSVSFKDTFNSGSEDIVLLLPLNKANEVFSDIQKINTDHCYHIISNPTIDFKDPLFKRVIFYDEPNNKPFNLNQEKSTYTNNIWLKFYDLTCEISKIVKSQQNNTKNYKGNIFVAETSIDQKQNRDILIRELEHSGYKVLPDKKLSEDLDEFSQQVHEYMVRCFLSVHIIGNEYAPLFKPIEVSGVEVQNDIFHEVAHDKQNSIFRLVWIAPDLKPKSEKQKKYIENFKRNIELLQHTEIIQAPIEVFKSIINKKIYDLQNEKTLKKPEVIKEKNSVYILSDDKESDITAAVIKQFEESGIEVLSYNKTSNKIDQVHFHYKGLIKSDAVVILYTQENIQWLNSKLSDIIKSPGFGKKNQFIVKSVLYFTKNAPQIFLNMPDLDLKQSNLQDLLKNIELYIEKLK